jgi:hypothetical protein
MTTDETFETPEEQPPVTLYKPGKQPQTVPGRDQARIAHLKSSGWRENADAPHTETTPAQDAAQVVVAQHTRVVRTLGLLGLELPDDAQQQLAEAMANEDLAQARQLVATALLTTNTPILVQVPAPEPQADPVAPTPQPEIESEPAGEQPTPAPNPEPQPVPRRTTRREPE